MGKKLVAVVLVIVIIAAVGIYIQYGQPHEPLTESGLKDIIKERYPDVGDSDISVIQKDNCTICDFLGCRTIENCWVANFTINQTTHGVVVDGGSGGVVQETEAPCTEWWCSAEPCVYFYREIISGGSRSYYNTGCNNPEPVCDQQYERCRVCENPEECIRRTITETEGTSYHYDIVGADAWGEINDTLYFCIIFDEGSEVFYNQTTIEECEFIISQWSRCYGSCDFKPEFGLIPP